MHETRSLPHDSASRGKSLAMAPRHWPMPRAASLMCVKMKMHIGAFLPFGGNRGLLVSFGEVNAAADSRSRRPPRWQHATRECLADSEPAGDGRRPCCSTSG